MAAALRMQRPAHALADVANLLQALTPGASETERLCACEHIKRVAEGDAAAGPAAVGWRESARLAVLKLMREDASEAVRNAAQGARITLEESVHDVPAWGSPKGQEAPSGANEQPAEAEQRPAAEGGSAAAPIELTDAPIAEAAQVAAVLVNYPETSPIFAGIAPCSTSHSGNLGTERQAKLSRSSEPDPSLKRDFLDNPCAGTSASDGAKRARTTSCSTDDLRTALAEYRRRKARETGKKAFSIFNNNILSQLVATMPRTHEALLNIAGIGALKLKEYGDDILAVIERVLQPETASTLPVAAKTSPSIYANGGPPEDHPGVSHATLPTAAPSALVPLGGTSGLADIHSSPSGAIVDQAPFGLAVGANTVVPTELNAMVPFADDTIADEPAGPILNPQQQRALDCVLGGGSLFLTGGAGVGKSFTLMHIIKKLRDKYGEEKVSVTASTGIAACHIGGTTLHSFAGVGLGMGSVNDLVGRMSKRSLKRWETCRALVIDEVSMIDGHLFDKIEAIARKVMARSTSRKLQQRANLPFGGIQLILCGDFHQLPPVGLSNGKAVFLFEAESWSTVVTSTIVLTEVFRQKEGAFVRLLNEMRDGALSSFHESLLARLAHNGQIVARGRQQALADKDRQDRVRQLSDAGRVDKREHELKEAELQLNQLNMRIGELKATRAQVEKQRDLIVEAIQEARSLYEQEERQGPSADDQCPGALRNPLGIDPETDQPELMLEPVPSDGKGAQSSADPPHKSTYDEIHSQPSPVASSRSVLRQPSDESEQLSSHQTLQLPSDLVGLQSDSLALTPQLSQSHSLTAPPAKVVLRPARRPLRLYALNGPADAENSRELARISGPAYQYVAKDTGSDPGALRLLQENCIVPTELVLKVGAQVLLCKNLDPARRLVNGSRGRVIGFKPKDPGELGDVAAGPKSQSCGRMLYPEVEFEIEPGFTIPKLVTTDVWTIESGGKELARRVHVPLKLAWAISIHKSQGMTLTDVEIDLARCFETGQAYVALSRAVDLQGCTLLSFDPCKVRAHPKVKDFYDRIEASSASTFEDGALPVSFCSDYTLIHTGEPTAPHRSNGGLTDAQKQRMEENRMRALALRAHKQCQSPVALPTVAP